MEYFDVIDENGEANGKVKSRDDVHRDGDWHRTVHVWIINSKNELLLQLRCPNKDSYPNMWDISVAGHLSAGQKNTEGAIREIKEEIGIDITEDKIEYLFTVIMQDTDNNGLFIDNEYNDVYLVQMDLELSQLKIQEEEISEVKLIPFKELERLINEEQKDIVTYEEEYKRLFNILHERFD